MANKEVKVYDSGEGGEGVKMRQPLTATQKARRKKAMQRSVERKKAGKIVRLKDAMER